MALDDKAVVTKGHKEEEKHGYEFLGPPGAFAISFLLPVLVYVFVFACNGVTGCPAPSLLHPSTLSLDQLKREVNWPGLSGLVSWEANVAVAGYYVLNLILYKILPAASVQGTELRSGGRLQYRLNTLVSSTTTFAILLAGTIAQGADFPVWTFITENYVQIITANVLFSYIIATFCYVRSFSVRPGNKENRELAAGGQSGNMLYDWFIGRELNPRVVLPFIGEVDIKIFMELRPGMMGWAIINMAWCAQQYRNYGYVTDSSIFITIGQALYIIDSWWNEAAILTTIDLTTDGFGTMLAYGDVGWVPFVYSLQTRYLAYHPISLGVTGTAGILAVIGAGFFIFRSANSQKNAFRTNPDDPKVAHLEYIRTKSGSKLLTTGWWGVARHINYFGDWLQSWGYSLPTGLAGYQILAAGTGAPGAYVMRDGREVIQGEAKGFAVWVTYFYILYFAVLLIHRERRDDAKCERKYGEDWVKYKNIVRSRIIPGVY